MAQLGLAFVAGLISFLSPCVLPLIPIYLAYLTGTSIGEMQLKSKRRLVLLHAGFFVLGFSLVFIAMGATASALGQVLNSYRGVLERLGGVVLILFGLWMIGVLKSGLLYKEARFHFQEKPAGFAGSVLVGAAFAAGWTPCVGPVLSTILGMAALSGSLAKGILLLTVYSIGFALPLMACALAVEKSTRLLDRIKPWLGTIEKGTGVVLVALGIFMAGGWFSRFATWPLSYFSGWVKLFGKLGL
ncbi:MAG: cytochrome c biogenesis protein CcdA [Elusimicrobiota bacterium]